MSGLDRLIDEEKLHRMEGTKGVQNLARVARVLGYKDTTYFGQFSPVASYGDLINFLEDNPGAIEAVLNFIRENEEIWADELPAEEECDEE